MARTGSRHRWAIIQRQHQIINVLFALLSYYNKSGAMRRNATAWDVSDPCIACRLWMSARIQWLSGQSTGTGIALTLSLGLCFPPPCYASILAYVCH